MPKPYHHGDLRQALLKAGETELEERGLAQFSLRSCAKRAGVSHAAPAHTFGNVDGLLAALSGVGFERLSASMEEAMAGRSGMSRLIGSGLGYVAFARANKALFELMFGGRVVDLPADERPPSSSDRAFGILKAAVAEAVGAEAIESRDHWLDVAMAWAIVHGIAHLLNAGRLSWVSDDRQIEGLLVRQFGTAERTEQR